MCAAVKAHSGGCVFVTLCLSLCVCDCGHLCAYVQHGSKTMSSSSSSSAWRRLCRAFALQKMRVWLVLHPSTQQSPRPEVETCGIALLAQAMVHQSLSEAAAPPLVLSGAAASATAGATATAAAGASAAASEKAAPGMMPLCIHVSYTHTRHDMSWINIHCKQ